MKKEKSVDELVLDLKKYQAKIEKTVNEIEQKLSNGRNDTFDRGWCSQCGEDFDLKEEWKYNTHCGSCGYPIPIFKIIKRPDTTQKEVETITPVESPKVIENETILPTSPSPSRIKERKVLSSLLIILGFIIIFLGILWVSNS